MSATRNPIDGHGQLLWRRADSCSCGQMIKVQQARCKYDERQQDFPGEFRYSALFRDRVQTNFRQLVVLAIRKVTFEPSSDFGLCQRVTRPSWAQFSRPTQSQFSRCAERLADLWLLLLRVLAAQRLTVINSERIAARPPAAAVRRKQIYACSPNISLFTFRNHVITI